ncbi:MAG: CoA ester lyase [Deltaproteobacteria bacterium]|nr:CoA ester lyase [Deltaproteobacteria bacterium]
MKRPGFIRTALFVPGNQPDRVDKAVHTGADAVIIDLEDAVPLAEKEKTRAMVRDKLIQHDQRAMFVRVNGLETGFLKGDLEVVAVGALAGIMLPKAESAAHVREISARLNEVEKAQGIPLGTISVLPLIESARAVQNIFEIVSVKTDPPRFFFVAFGAADYALDMGIELTRQGTELLYARSRICIACRAAGIDAPLDTPFMIDIRDLKALKAEARQARQIGFQGKLCIHPDQVSPCNEVFSPTEEEIKQAAMAVQAFEDAEARGIGAIQIEGRFIDYAVVERARRTLEMAALLHGIRPD